MKIGKYKLEHILDPRRWWMFIKHILEGKRSELDQLAYAEQVVFRASSCRSCLENGECHVCGCKTPALFLERSASCSDFRWGPVMGYEEWEEYKKMYKINIGVIPLA